MPPDPQESASTRTLRTWAGEHRADGQPSSLPATAMPTPSPRSAAQRLAELSGVSAPRRGRGAGHRAGGRRGEHRPDLHEARPGSATRLPGLGRLPSAVRGLVTRGGGDRRYWPSSDGSTSTRDTARSMSPIRSGPQWLPDAGWSIITNAVGFIRGETVPGDLVLIADHLNLSGASPLAGLPTEPGYPEPVRGSGGYLVPTAQERWPEASSPPSPRGCMPRSTDRSSRLPQKSGCSGCWGPIWWECPVRWRPSPLDRWVPRS